jgi:hypothetical protein
MYLGIHIYTVASTNHAGWISDNQAPAILIPMLLVEVINDLSGSRHNLHSIWTVRVTTQSDRRMPLERQLNVLARHRCNRRILKLCRNVFLRLFQSPRPLKLNISFPIHVKRSTTGSSTHFFLRSITSVPSLLYFTSPYASAKKGNPSSSATCSWIVPANPKTGVPFGTAV